MSFPPWQVDYPRNIINRRINEPEIAMTDGEFTTLLDSNFDAWNLAERLNQWSVNADTIAGGGLLQKIVIGGTQLPIPDFQTQANFTAAGSDLTCTETGLYEVKVHFHGVHTAPTNVSYASIIQFRYGAEMFSRDGIFVQADSGFDATFICPITSGTVCSMWFAQASGTVMVPKTDGTAGIFIRKIA